MTQRRPVIAFLGVPEFWRKALSLALARVASCEFEVASLDERLEGLVLGPQPVTFVRCSAEHVLSPRLRRLVAGGRARVVVIHPDGRHVTIFESGQARRASGLGIDGVAALIVNQERGEAQ